MLLGKKAVVLIAYSEEYVEEKVLIEKTLEDNGLVVKKIKLKHKTKKHSKGFERIKHFKTNLTRSVKCVIVFYLSNNLLHSDLEVLDIFTGKGLKRKLKLCYFYGKNCQGDDTNQRRIYDDPHLLYVFARQKSNTGFSYMLKFCEQIRTNRDISIIDLHENILEDNLSSQDIFSTLYLFSSLTSSVIMTKHQLKDYFSISSGTRSCAESNMAIDAIGLSPSDQNVDDDNIENYGDKGLNKEFSDIPNLVEYLEEIKDRPNKMKRLFFYVIYSVVDPSSERNIKERAEDLITMLETILQSPSFEKNKKTSFYLECLNITTDALGKSDSTFSKILKIIYIIYKSCPKNIELNDICEIGKNICEKVKKFLMEKITNYNSGEDESKLSCRNVIFTITKLIYQIIILKNLQVSTLMYAAQLLKYIYEAYNDEEIRNEVSYSLSHFNLKEIGMNLAINVLKNVGGFSKGQIDASRESIRLQKKTNEKINKDFCIIINNMENESSFNLCIKEHFGNTMHIEDINDCVFEVLMVRIRSLGQQLLSTQQKVLVFFLSKGIDDDIVTKDGQRNPTSYFIKAFSEIFNSPLEGKLKFILFEINKSSEKKEKKTHVYPNLKDFFIINGTFPQNEQSSFTKLFLQKLKQTKKTKSLSKVCVEIQQQMNSSSSTQGSNISFENHMLKKVYL